MTGTRLGQKCWEKKWNTGREGGTLAGKVEQWQERWKTGRKGGTMGEKVAFLKLPVSRALDHPVALTGR